MTGEEGSEGSWPGVCVRQRTRFGCVRKTANDASVREEDSERGLERKAVKTHGLVCEEDSEQP